MQLAFHRDVRAEAPAAGEQRVNLLPRRPTLSRSEPAVGIVVHVRPPLDSLKRSPTLRATGRVVRRGGGTCVLAGEISQEGRLVATATAAVRKLS